MAKLYWGKFGHGLNPNAKEYVYWGSDNYRTGQNVNVPVTHWMSGKNFNTMFTITHSSGSKNAIEKSREVMFDIGKGIKNINGTDVSDLPGYMDFSSKAEWANYAEFQQGESIMDRLSEFRPENYSQEAYGRLLGGI